MKEEAKGNRLAGALRIICLVVFVLYILCLIKIVLFKYVTSFASAGRLISGLLSGELDGFRALNLIPFKTISGFAGVLFTQRGFANLAGNVLIFAPLGYFLPLLFKKCRKIWPVLAVSVLVSAAFEACQYLLYLGSADIDDLILNLAGTAIGYGFYRLIARLTRKNAVSRYLVTALLSAAGFAVALFVALDYFDIMFGINTSKNAAPAKVDISAGDFEVKVDEDNNFEITGHIESMDGESVTVNKIAIKELEGGASIAVSSEENKNLKTVRLTDDTQYYRKDVYDVNGDRVETYPGSADDLAPDALIIIKGFELDGELYAEEITLESFMF